MLVKNIVQITSYLSLHIVHSNKLRHLLMILSFMLILLAPQMKDRYQKQQPSLRTRIYDINNSPINFSIPYTQVYPGVKISVVQGLLSYQSLIITYGYDNEKIDQQKILQDVYYSLVIDKNLAKNIVFISYQNYIQFNKFLKSFNTLSYSQQYINSRLFQKLGVIRAGINVQFANKGSKLFYKLYGNGGLYSDLDYYLSIKQLLQSLTINWLPCQIIYKNIILNNIRKNYKDGQLFIKQLLCQFHQILFQQQQQQIVHSLMLQQGIQSATIKTYGSSSQQQIDKLKLSKLILSFIKQFSLFQDHLHSASTIYYPFNQTHSINIKGIILPGLIFLIFTIAYLINLYCHSPFTSSTKYINIPILLSIFICSWQYYLLKTIKFSFWLGIIFRIIIFKFYYIENIQRKFYRILLSAFNSVMLYHLVFYLTPLSYLCMITVCMITFLQPKIALIISWTFVLVIIYYSQCPISYLFNISNPIMIVIYPLSIWLTLI